MTGTKTLFDCLWDVDKYKSNYDSEHWDLCKAFMESHKTKYPEQKLANLTEAFYQIGVYGSSYDPKTTRLVNALTVEVLDNILKSHPGVLKHPFNKSAVITNESSDGSRSQSSKEEKGLNQPSSIWDVQVDQNIIANVLMESQLKELFKGFVIIYDIKRTSTMNDNKAAILEESFKRSKYGACHWAKDVTQNNICPIRMALKWRHIVLAEAVGSDEISLKTRLAQAILSKMSTFSIGIEAKWSYYRDGRLSDSCMGFLRPNPRKSNIYRVLQRSQFKDMAEITSYIETFANSDSFAELSFGMDFSNQEKKQLMEYIDKNWSTKLTYRTISKVGVKNKNDSHVFVYHIRSGEEMRRWLEQTGEENDRYRMVPPGKHRRAGECDNNVREVLTTDAVEMPKEVNKSVERETTKDKVSSETGKRDSEKEDREIIVEEVMNKKNFQAQESRIKDAVKEQKDSEKIDKDSEKKSKAIEKDKDTKNENKEKETSVTPKDSEDDLEKLLDGFVLFYDANKKSEIDKDDWFSALCESFNLSKFGPLEVVSENVRPLRTRCVLKWKDRILAMAEGLSETQAKTAATLQLISKLEPFTYIIQAKEEYFYGGKVPPFIDDPESKSEFFRLVHRKDLPNYFSIFQTIDEFARSQSHGELIFGPDFTWELKNEIVVYLKAKGLSHRYFTQNDRKPWTHMAIYRNVDPEQLQEHLLKIGGENEKYKLIPPAKAEPLIEKTPEESKVESTKGPGKPSDPPSAKKLLEKVADKRKREEVAPQEPLLEDIDTNKIQIKLKKFKVEKVVYPEDTGGDFPGLILWIGIRKNSTWQKNLLNILLDSFKLSKYGELVIEEVEENVWGKKEPFRKCVIKANRKVLAVGLGQSKQEAKNSASLQVLRQLREHCYTIQAKESYFKEGKATPYDFNPDPAKGHVYKVMKRNQFKDRAAMSKYVNEFSKYSCPEEVIFGDDFTYDEREYILDNCRLINLNYRLMKCQSITKIMHTHIAIFHQLPPPVIKAELMKAGGENDMYRLVPPGGKITNQNNDADLWPDTLIRGEVHNVGSNPIPSIINRVPVKGPNIPSDQKRKAIDNGSEGKKANQQNLNSSPGKSNSAANLETKLQPKHSQQMNAQPLGPQSLQNQPVGPQALHNQPLGPQPLHNQPLGPQPLHNQPLGPQPLHNQPFGPQPLHNQPIGPQSYLNQPLGPQPLHNQPNAQPFYQQPMGPQPQFAQLPVEVQPFQEIPFGPQPLFIPPPPICGQPFMDTPLQFGPNPPVQIQQPPCGAGPVDVGSGQTLNNTILPDQTQISVPSVTITVQNSPPSKDLREALAKKRQVDTHRGSPERVVTDVTDERRRIDSEEDGWSRKVFVAEQESAVNQGGAGQKGNSLDLREKLRHKEPIKGFGRSSPKRNFSNKFQRVSPERRRPRFEPSGAGRSTSPHPTRWRMSPGRKQSRDTSQERWRSRERSSEERIVRHRSSSHERIVFHDSDRNFIGREQNGRFRSRSRSFSPRRRQRSHSPMIRFRDLWDNIPARFSESIFMYKYVKQDSTTETDPYALLRATRSLAFNVDFDFIKEEIAKDEWCVSVELVTDNANIHPLVGEGMARTEKDASRRAALHAVDTVQKACRVIEPNYRYFCEGGVPEFIARKYPRKTSVYEIIQNMDPGVPLARYTVEMMFKMFISSDLEDIFFLADDFSYIERVLVIEIANQMNLWWRLFGPRHPKARPDDIVSTQHVCVFKQKSALQLIKELIEKGGHTEKYSLVDPRNHGVQLVQPRFNR